MTHDDFMYLFTHYWWLMFPLFWFIYSAYCTSAHYAHRRAKLEVLKTYAQQGKDLPPDVAKALGGEGKVDVDRWADRAGRCGPYREQRRVVLFAAIAAGFSYAYYASPTHNEAFGIVAVIMGALAVGYLLIVLALPKPDAK